MIARRAVFLDRDGVLNAAQVREGRPYPPQSLAELLIYDEARTACRLLKSAGYMLICVTNQPDLARGNADRDQVEKLNQTIAAALELDAVRMCPHDDADQCQCRKPKPGLLVAAAREFGIDLSVSVMVGDRWRDVEAGQAAGCRTIFIDRGYDERQPVTTDYRSADILDAANWICRHGPTHAASS
jgi:D-glycero-D-manno-heptose 1,7-bisphosphate phosphatase